MPIPLLYHALNLGAEFVNGWTDAPNAIAVVATKALKPKTAVALAVVGNIQEPLRQAVAKPSGRRSCTRRQLTWLPWGRPWLGSWSGRRLLLFGIPPVSHALLAGLAGAGLATAGPAALLLSGWKKVFLGLVISVLFGAAGGFGLVWVLKFFCMDWSQTKKNRIFNTLQVIAASGMAFSHGSNDGQKFIGLFTLTMVLSGCLPVFQVQPAFVFNGIPGLRSGMANYRKGRDEWLSWNRIMLAANYRGFILFASSLGCP